jgi:peptidoglycan/xylan/chitin deacetylase (PgdA/CDA1 family)
MTLDEIRAELVFTDTAIAAVIGKRPRFLRPPFLEVTQTALNVMETMDYVPVIVNVDSSDWQFQERQDPHQVARGLQHSFESARAQGSFISLQHDTLGHVRSSNPERHSRERVGPIA